MSKKTETPVLVPVVGSILAWESQAAGSWKTKIGRVIRLPREGADKRTSGSKIWLEILATYHVPEGRGGRLFTPDDREAERLWAKLGVKSFIKLPGKPLKTGLASPNQVRIPQAWELKLAGVA